MKQIFCLFVLTAGLFLGCAGEKSPDRERLYNDVWQQDSLDARALMDSVMMKRLPDSLLRDTTLFPPQ